AFLIVNWNVSTLFTTHSARPRTTPKNLTVDAAVPALLSCRVPTATGFAAPWKRLDHWEAHKAEFPEIAHESGYERRAVAFMSDPPGSTVLECVRLSDGDIIHYDRATNTIGFMWSDGRVRTLFRPDPSWHGFASNLAYFQHECTK